MKMFLNFIDVGSIKFWFTGEFEEEVEETTVAAPQSIHEQEDGVILAICATGNVCFVGINSLCNG